MFCTHCGGGIEPSDLYCVHCGAPLGVESGEKGTHFLPLLIMVILFIIGLLLFYSTRENLPLFQGDPSVIARIVHVLHLHI